MAEILSKCDKQYKSRQGTEIEWRLESSMGEFVDSSVYTVSGEKGERITINPKVLRDDLIAKLEGENESEDYYCNLYAIIKAGEKNRGENFCGSIL